MPFAVSNHKIWGQLKIKDSREKILGPIIIYSLIHNILSLIEKPISSYDKGKLEIIYQANSGKSDDLIAGEEGFDKFYNEFQDELDTIGKRPDLLVFKKDDFDKNLGYDISKLPHIDIESYVKKAIAGLEIRSSAFLIDKYEAEMQLRTEVHLKKALEIKDKILSGYMDILEHPNKSHFVEILKGINEHTINAVSFRGPSWKATERLQELSLLFPFYVYDITKGISYKNTLI